MLDKPKSICFQEGGGNLVVTVDDIGANWRSKPQDNYKVSRILYIIVFGFFIVFQLKYLKSLNNFIFSYTVSNIIILAKTVCSVLMYDLKFTAASA